MTLMTDPPTAAPADASSYAGVLRDLRRSAPGAESVEFAITPLDATGLPVWSVTQWQQDGEMINGIGYGLTDDRARVGGWAELLEQAGSHHAMARLPRTRASHADLLRRGVAAVDPLSLRLPVGTTYTPDQPIVWVPARRLDPSRPWDAQDEVLVPAEAAATHRFDLRLQPGEEPLYTPISNGNGAGDTIERAITHGLLELVQRDGNSAGYRAVDRGVRVELDDVRHPDTRALLARLDAAGIEVLVKLADTNLGMTNVYVVGHERDPNAAAHPILLTGCGEAAHPDREQALLKALTEFCASRVRKRFTHGPLEPMEHLFPPGYLDRFARNPATVEENRSFQAVREWVHLPAAEVVRRLAGTVFRVDRTVRFSDLPTVPYGSADAIDDLLRVTVERFAAEGLPIYWVDYTPAGAPCRAAKVIVPPMEVETMTYRRIGPRNLRRLLDRGFDFVGHGEPPPAGALPVPLDAAGLSAVGGPCWFHPARADALADPLYAMYREPEIHAIALSERAEGRGRRAGGGNGS